MKHRLIYFEEGDSPTDLRTTVICASDSPEPIEKFIERGKTVPFDGLVLPKAGRRGRPVRVAGVVPESALSDEFSVGVVFPSAQAASDALRAAGVSLTYNLVLKKLNEVRHLGPENRLALVEGITFQYEEDHQAELAAAGHID